MVHINLYIKMYHSSHLKLHTTKQLYLLNTIIVTDQLAIIIYLNTQYFCDHRTKINQIRHRNNLIPITKLL